MERLTGYWAGDRLYLLQHDSNTLQGHRTQGLKQQSFETPALSVLSPSHQKKSRGLMRNFSNGKNIFLEFEGKEWGSVKDTAN